MLQEGFKVLVVSSEVAPFAKTGGLADVTGSLPKALATKGIDVRVAMPRYKQIKNFQYLTDLPVEMDGHVETAVIKKTELHPGEGDSKDTLPVYLVENYQFFYRDGLYGHGDDGERFNFFCKAVLAMLPRINFKPSIIHCNDWQTALIPLFLHAKYGDDPYYNGIATLFTIHNLQYQGQFPRSILKILGLSDEYFTPERLEFYGQVNYLKAGLNYADLLNTVSKKYAMEIQTPEMGEGLDGLLRYRGNDLYGILNGIDYQEMDPKTDPYIPHHYSADDLDGKHRNKKALQREMDLPEEDIPLMGIISRLAGQKGLDLLAGVIEPMLDLGVQFVLLGSGEDYYQRLFSELKVKHRQRMAVKIGFDPSLAQRIYAGSDMFLMPSRFEPCGLGQLISLRYGTIPIVRATGGLEDTISDYDSNPEHGNGFSFKEYSEEAFWDAIKRAVRLCRESPDDWRKLQERGMRADYSWSASADKYLNLYQRAIQKHETVQYQVG